MTEFEFNCMTTANHLMAKANRQHHLAVHQAKECQDTRAENRYARSMRRAYILDTAVMAAAVIGIAVTTWFLTSIGVL